MVLITTSSSISLQKVVFFCVALGAYNVHKDCLLTYFIRFYVVDLKAELKKRGLKATGRKGVLQKRLQEALDEEEVRNV